MHSPSRTFSRSFSAIGTRWQIDTERPVSAAQWATVDERVEEFDRAYSRFRSDSLVTKLAEAAGVVEFPVDVVPMLAFYRELYDLTNGAVTPLIGGALSDLGYGAGYRLTPTDQVRRTPAWDDVMVWDGPVVTTTAPVVLDFGAAGKGYLVDILGELLGTFDVGSVVIDGSGDLLHRGTDILRVGMEHPADPSMVIGVIPLRSTALAASAANRRSWGDGLHHVIDPHTGSPTADIVATWVVAPSAMVADGLATALFFADPGLLPALESHFSANWARVTTAGSASWSPHFDGEIFR